MNSSLRSSLKSPVVKVLHWSFYLALAWYMLTFPWQIGWNLVGDPFALGPYEPWLELRFPVAGVGIWALFFTQWTLGELRPIHNSRWLYLLLFASVLMVNVLFSTNPVGSLGYLSLFLSASLMLSVSLNRVFHNRYFWGWFSASVLLNVGLYTVVPGLVNPILLLFGTWFATLHGWQRISEPKWRLLLMMTNFMMMALLPLSFWLELLVTLSFGALWLMEYKTLRRKSLRPWYTAFCMIGIFWGFFLIPQAEFTYTGLSVSQLGGQFSWWHGVGWGQLEWAQYLAQEQFGTQGVQTSVWGLVRWWYETGLLAFLWLPIFWLLTVGHGQAVGFRTLLFWGIVLMAPELWLTPAGIFLGSFWFFNRESWLSPSQQYVPSSLDRS